MYIAESKIEEVIRRVVEAVSPLQIILFGSAARGEDRPESDIDVMVVVPDGSHRLDTAQTIYRNLRGLNVAVDVVVATQSDLTDYKDSPGLIYREALRNGRLLHAA